MMKCETGKWEARTNREAVFFKPLFYISVQNPYLAVISSMRKVKEYDCNFMHVCMLAYLIVSKHVCM